MSFADAIEILAEFAEAAERGRVTVLDLCGDAASSRLLHGADRRTDAADAFIKADEQARVSIRTQCAVEMARIVRERASRAASAAASYRERKARQARELRARRAIKAGRCPGVTGRPQTKKAA
jgi:hypothetical protein